MRVELLGMNLHYYKGPKRAFGFSLVLSSGEDKSRKMAVYDPGSEPSLDTKSVSTLIFNFPASIRVRNKFLLLYGIVRAAPNE